MAALYAPLVVSMATAQPLAPEEKMKYAELRSIDVSKHVEKKGSLSYLSWTWAVDMLLQNDPIATWEFGEPKYFGDTVMVYCSVTAFGKTMRMHLPVMNNRNEAIVNPDSRRISDAQMRCLAKCIACFGIGLYLYAGEDIPPLTEEEQQRLAEEKKAIENATLTDEDIDKIDKLAQQVGFSLEKILEAYKKTHKVESMKQIPRTQYGKIIAGLNRKRLENEVVSDNG